MARSLKIPAAFVGAFSVNTLIQHYFGTKADFFHGSFVTDKDEDDIAKFYQAEDMLKLLAVHPLLYYLFMDRAKQGEPPKSEEEMHFSINESRMIVQKIGMEVSFERFEECEEINGKTVRTRFERHERFLQYIPMLYDYGMKVLLWDQTWTFGFRNLEDGQTEVYHTGKFFWGPWPVRIIIHLHQKYLLWACKDFIKNESFSSNGVDDDAKQRREDIMMPNLVGAIWKVGRWTVFELAEVIGWAVTLAIVKAELPHREPIFAN